MKTRTKIILYFLLELVLSLSVLGLVGLVFLKTTVYNPDFIKRQLKESAYYTNLSTTIYDKMSENVYQTALDESVLENLYTVESLEKTVNEMIDDIFAGKEYEVDTTAIKEVLENNIEAYLEKHNMEVSNQKSLDDVVNVFTSIYTKEITVSNMFKHLGKIINKTSKIVNIGIIACLILTILLALIVKFKFKEPTFAIPFIFTSALFILVKLYIEHNLIINNIYLGDPKLTGLVQKVLSNIIELVGRYGLVAFIIGCVAAAIEYIVSSLNKPEEKAGKKISKKSEQKIAKKTIEE